MERVFLTCTERDEESLKVTVAVFLKGSGDHSQDLMGFLRSQHIECEPIDTSQREQMVEAEELDAAIRRNLEVLGYGE